MASPQPDVVIPAFVPPLRASCAAHLANSLVTRHRKDLTSFGDVMWETAQRKVHDSFSFLANHLPIELFCQLIAEIRRSAPSLALVAALLFPDRMEDISILHNPEHFFDGTASIPLSFLSSRFRTLPSCITRVDLNESSISDTVLEALGSSPAAPTLEYLRADGLALTDASSGVWAKLSKLQSLYLGDCPAMSLVSFRAIAQLQELHTLEVANAIDYIADLANVFLTGDALPSLKSIQIDGSTGGLNPAEIVLEVLKEMKNPQRMERIVIADMFHPDASACHEALLRVCPNIKFDLAGKDQPSSSEEPESVTALTFSKPMQQSEVDRLSSCYHNLVDISISDIRDATIDLSGLQSVTSLTLSTSASSAAKISALPPNLETLNWDESEGEEGHAANVEGVFNALLAHCPNLRRIAINHIRPGFWSKQQVITLLSSFPKLESFRAVSIFGVRSATVGAFPVAHDNLTEFAMHQTSDHFAPVLVHAPKLETLQFPCLDNDTDLIKRVSLPSIRRIQADHCNTRDISIFLRNFKSPEHIQAFRLEFPIGEQSHLIETLPRCWGLTSLYVDPNHLEEATISTIVSSLPFLSSLTCKLVDIQNWSWLKHPRLATVQINTTDLMIDCHDLGESDETLLVDPSTLPSLVRFRLNLKEHALSRIIVRDLPHLNSLHLTGKSELRYSVSVMFCPLLTSLSLDDLEYEHFELRGVPNLSCLCFQYGIVPLEHLDKIDTGPLRRLSILHDYGHYANNIQECYEMEQFFKNKATDDKPLHSEVEPC